MANVVASIQLSFRDVVAILEVFRSFKQLLSSRSSCLLSPTLGLGATLPPHSFGERLDRKYTHIHQLFNAHAKSFPSDVAVVDHLANSISYGELDRQSLLLAGFLRTKGACVGSNVCLVGHRSMAQVTAILAVLRAGGAYIPLDGDCVPDQALRGILSDAKPVYTLISKSCASREAVFGDVPFGYIEDILSLISSYAPHEEWLTTSNTTTVSDPAYIIYTSGTTGVPKGVVVSHANVVNLLSTAPGNLHIRRGTKVAQLLNIAFDMCAWETLGCLMNGGTLHLRGLRRKDWIATMKAVDVVISTPSILVSHDPEDYPNLKVVATAGEPCAQSLADRWASRVEFYNSCGPTEVTIVNTMRRHVFGTPVSIGRPTPNNSVYVLDDNLNPVSPGQSGVMWAGGRGVSLGYLQRPELTATKFLDDPFQKGGKMYNTGDIGRWRNGQLEHLGRVDDQVKIKLDGVSAAMLTCEKATSACALLVESELIGFYTPGNLLAPVVNQTVTVMLPPYAVPTRYIALDALPLTSNGKVDKTRLKELARGSS